MILKILKIKNNLITRFAPESNWNLHIGHLKNIFFNLELSKIYNGVMNLRVDDTNNKKNKKKYKMRIIKDIKKIFKINEKKINKRIFYSSNYFYKFYQYLEFIIKTIKFDNYLKIIRKLKNGNYKERKRSVRIIRKRIYKIKYKKHYRLLWSWFFYTLYDYSHNLSDKIENINYSICSFEFKKNKSFYNILINIFYIKDKSIQIEIKKLCLKNTLLSKSKLKKLKGYIKNSNNKNIKSIKNINLKKNIILLKNNNNKIAIKNFKTKKLIKIKIKNLLYNKFFFNIKKKILSKNLFFREKFFFKFINGKKK